MLKVKFIAVTTENVQMYKNKNRNTFINYQKNNYNSNALLPNNKS